MSEKIEFKRTENMIKDIAGKINTLIEIYAEKEGLLPYMTKPHYIIQYSSEFGLSPSDTKHPNSIEVEAYQIDVVKFCKESHDLKMQEYYGVLSSFVTETELQNLLTARYLPDYLTIKNIFSILLYEVPRKVKKFDLEYLNRLYKKYNVKFK